VCHTDLQQDISRASFSHQTECVLFRASFSWVCHGLDNCICSLNEFLTNSSYTFNTTLLTLCVSNLFNGYLQSHTVKKNRVPTLLLTKNCRTFQVPRSIFQDPVISQQCVNIATNSSCGVCGALTYLQPRKRTLWQQLWLFSSAETCPSKAKKLPSKFQDLGSRSPGLSRSWRFSSKKIQDFPRGVGTLSK